MAKLLKAAIAASEKDSSQASSSQLGRQWTKRVDSLRRLNVEFFKNSQINYGQRKQSADEIYQRVDAAIKDFAVNITQEPILLQEVEQNYFDVLKLLVVSARRLGVANQAMVGITKSFVAGHAAEFLIEVRYLGFCSQYVANLQGLDWTFCFTGKDPADESYPCALSKDGKKIWWSAEAEIYCLRKHIDDGRVDEVWPTYAKASVGKPTQPEAPA